jgi:phytol kinase
MLGKHVYQVRSLSSVPATRSLEGSAAVFLMSAVALALAAAVSPQITLGPYGAAKVLAIASASALVEAISPHGWDNLTLQLIPSALAWAWLA